MLIIGQGTESSILVIFQIPEGTLTSDRLTIKDQNQGPRGFQGARIRFRVFPVLFVAQSLLKKLFFLKSTECSSVKPGFVYH